MRVGVSNMIQRPNIKSWNCVQRDHQGKESKHVQVKSEMDACDSMRTVHKEWVPAGQAGSQYY